MVKPSKNRIVDIPLEDIDEPDAKIRLDINDDALEELGRSISGSGLEQPIKVRPKGGRYEIVFGHRRFLASKKASLPSIRAIVEEMSDQRAAISRATENLGREDLTPIEEAATFKDLFETHKMTYERISAMVGKSAATVRRRIDLLSMPPVLQQALHQKKISISVAEELWPISNLEDLEYYLSFCIENGATKETARDFTKQWKDQARRRMAGSVEGGGVHSPQEPRPHYITCDICLEPSLIEDAVSAMICPTCRKLISGKKKEA